MYICVRNRFKCSTVSKWLILDKEEDTFMNLYDQSNISSIFSCNSEAFTPELLESLEESTRY